MQKREFHQRARTGKTRVWTIEVRGNTVITTFGELGGKMQEVRDRGHRKNIGRSNEVSEEEDAQNIADRQILLKSRQGYRPVGEEPPTEIDWYAALPQNLCMYKPANELSVTLQRKVVSGDAWLGRKRDGEMVPIVKNALGQCDIYSRRMLLSHHLEEGIHTWNDRFPHIVEEIESRDDIPPRTILLGDLVSEPQDDARWDVASIMKSKTGEAGRIQRHAPLFFYCWDIAFWDGIDLLSTTPTEDRFEVLWEVFGREWDGSSWILPVDVWRPEKVKKYVSGLLEPGDTVPADNLTAASLFAKRMGWEGWVVVDPKGVLGDRAYNFRGKPDRPSRYSGKLKPVFELDAMLCWDPDNGEGKWGRGKHQGKVGSVSLYQYDAVGNLVYLCDCGSGIDDDFRKTYTKPSDFPLVGEIEFTDRTFTSMGAKTNALQFPRLSRVRHDKDADECIEEKLTYGESSEGDGR